MNPNWLRETLEHAYATDDLRVAELLSSLLEDDKIGGLLEAIAHSYVNKDWGYTAGWLENAVEDAITYEVAENDAKCQIERGGY